ncbi:hypothetical protein BX666DRAFT_1868888 [Dichotomocladium elegans]|nr:hypothetical protein BX666DRAFT_1868888 [Dichotomocladium elegans]
MRPVAVGKHVVERSPFIYQTYPDTPPSLSALSFIDTDEAGPTGRLAKREVLFHMLGIKLTKYSALDFFACIASAQKPIANENHFFHRNWTMEELVDMLNRYLGDVESSSNVKTKFTNWLGKGGCFGHSKICKVGAAIVRMRRLWLLKEEHRRKRCLNKLFNTSSYRKKVRATSSTWCTVGYCRKSQCNVTQDQRVQWPPRMVEIMRVRCLREKVYVSPICSVRSSLPERDVTINNSVATVLDKIKYKDAHLQDKAEIVIYKGHKFVILSRQQLLHGDSAKKFDCRAAPIKRSTL